MTDNTNQTTAVTTSACAADSSVPCRIMKLPPELRKMIYDYYFEDRKLPLVLSSQYSMHPYYREETSATQALKPYFGLLHHSSGVRAENVRAIYRACFSGKWLVVTINKHTNELERTVETCSLIRKVNKRTKFGLRFVVGDYSESTFLSFVDSFFGLRAEGERYLRLEFVRPTRPWGEQSLLSSTSAIFYTYSMHAGRNKELWMFGSLAKLDWSKFSFEFPAPELERSFLWALPRKASTQRKGEVECCGTDGEHESTLGSEDEISGLDCDNEDGEYEQEDPEGDMFTANDEAVFPDVEVDEFMIGNEDENGYIDGEYMLDGEGELGDEDALESDCGY